LLLGSAGVSGFGVFCLFRLDGVSRWVVFGLLVFLFFVFMAGLDFVVHGVLYGFGLRFSFDWAVFYWRVFGFVFFVFGLTIAFAYWLGSGRSRRDFWVSLCIFLSIVLPFLGGLEDILWFVVWGGGLPDANVIWWWTPWYGLFGFWNISMQITALCVTFSLVVAFWGLALRRPE